MEKKFGGKLVRRGVAKLLRRGELRPREGGEERVLDSTYRMTYIH